MKLVLVRANFNYYFDDIKDFCQLAVKEMTIGKQKRDVEQTIKNMDYRNWETNNHCLLHRLYVKEDFKGMNGMFCLIYDNNKIVSVSGVSKYNNEIAMLARRQYSLRPYRMKGIFQKYCMDPQIEWSRDNGFKACVILINEYNKVLYKMLERVATGKSGAAGQPSFPKYKTFIPLGGLFKINKADQYVLLHKIDSTFDERSLKWDH